ncbi:hypothetical protein PR202_gn00118 [Eleusine coracana subsp. coracana]|uniref:Uncharacterized protein n=1 Tax=Eleusine coracana subsp. coracana TaxID=191504 RepID=A0AAV5F7G0_ELECO|nr:hypothetical protein PR202_gb20015 [Eleusine coracana subsp. coracana]GJN40815.1 hypothetical protein PR202_gn00118 [Eleusine coracana subsp. coracana]
MMAGGNVWATTLQLGALLALLIAVLWRLAWRPRAVARSFARQGILGPPYAFLTGSLLEAKRLAAAGRIGVPPLDAASHDIMPLVLPVVHTWTAEYGKDSVLVQRSLPQSMSAVTAEVTEQMLKLWHEQILQSSDGQSAEIDVNSAMCELTKQTISRVAFGTGHREAGEVNFLLHEMQKHASAGMLDSPILWHLPTRRNRQMRHVDKLLRTKIMAMIQARVAAKSGKGSGYGDDLLGLMLDAWSPERQGRSETLLSTQEVIGECKTFFGAGQETTATLLVWTMFLLSTHPKWQEKVREEVIHEFGREIPNADDVSKLKLLHMVLLETLRLYPPIVYIQRTAASDVKLRGINVPRGTVISIPIGILHRDKEVWGSDADEFNPMRFQNGVSRAAKDPNALLSFSLGQRSCIGQSFSIIQAQVIMAMILRKFSFSLSPAYVHKPKYLLSLAPKSGMPLIFRNLDA